MMKKLFVMCFLWMAMLLSGCGQEAEETYSYPVLKMMTMGSEPAHMDEIYEQLDALTQSELGITVRLSFYQWEDEEETVQMLVNSNSFDIYVYGVAFGSEELAERGAYLNMSPYLEAVPELVDFYREQGVDLTAEETLYNLPRMLTSSGYGLFYREDLRKKWGLEPVTDFDTVEAYLYRAAEEYPTSAPINDKRFHASLLNLMTGGKYYSLGYGLGISYETGQLVCLLDTEEYRKVLETARKWYEDGIIASDILYLQENNTMTTLELMRQDMAAVEFCNHFSAICSNYVFPLLEAGPDWELGWMDYELYNGVSYAPYADFERGTGLAVGSGSRHPRSAMLLLEKMHTDPRYYNLLSYGVEGVHYHLMEDGSISYEGIPAENVFRGQVGLEQDSMALDQRYPGNWNEICRDVKERSEELSAGGQDNLFNRFSVNASEYGEYEEAMRVYTESRTRQMLETGTLDNVRRELISFRQELREAGYDEFVEEAAARWETFQREERN